MQNKTNVGEILLFSGVNVQFFDFCCLLSPILTISCNVANIDVTGLILPLFSIVVHLEAPLLILWKYRYVGI